MCLVTVDNWIIAPVISSGCINNYSRKRLLGDCMFAKGFRTASIHRLLQNTVPWKYTLL